MNVKDGDTVSVGMVLDDNAGCVQSVHLRAWLRLTCITYRSSVWWLQNVMTSSGVRTSAGLEGSTAATPERTLMG